MKLRSVIELTCDTRRCALKIKGGNRSDGVFKRFINWFSDAPIRLDKRNEMLEVVVNEARCTSDISPEANAALIEYSDILAGRQPIGQSHTEAEGPMTQAWRESQIKHQEAHDRYGITGSGR